MRLEKVELREGERVKCCKCLWMVEEAWADLEGEPFVDYYCRKCLEEGK